MSENPLTRCFELLEAGGTLVTANKRLARNVREMYARRQEHAGCAAWSTPDVLPWAAWLARLWSDAARAEPLPALPGEALEHELWHTAVLEDAGSSTLLDSRQAARDAREARQRLAAWRVSTATLARYSTDETRALLRWYSRVQRFCARENWLEPSRLTDELLARLPGLEALPGRCGLLGFDELTPLQDAFLAALAGRGTQVDFLARPDCNRSVRRIEAYDTRDELEAAARWARAMLARDAGARIGVVVPGLAGLRDDVRRIFTTVLQPQAELRDLTPGRLPFSISAAPAVADYPLVHAALLILEWARRPLPRTAVGLLLGSPWTGGAQQEWTGRALLDARLREAGWLTLDVRRVAREAAASFSPHACPQLAHRLTEVAARLPELAGQRLPGDWLASFDSILSAAGWPGERSLSSDEYQTVDAFRGVERDLYTLGAVTGPVTYADALASLTRLAGARAFQPESPAAALEILGTLEAAGQAFNHLWICGLHDEAWPPAPRPNGFLPVALQRELGMPHSSPERELEFTLAVTARLIGSAHDVIVSSPRRDGDRPLRPSPLIGEIEVVTRDILGLDTERQPAVRLFEARALERLACDSAPALGPLEPARGGTSLLKHQSACPFRAFAEHRLHAGELETPAPGIDARARGNVLHETLRIIWAELRDQPGLLRLGEAQRQALVARAVRTAARALSPLHPARLVALEAERAERLAGLLLEVEGVRAPFEVEAREVRRRVPVGDLEITTFIDRIDRLSGGDTLIVDYKTGRVSLGDLTGERLSEPQLPLYAIAGDPDPASGVAFASLRNGEVGFLGVARDADVAPGVVELDAWRERPVDNADWESLLATWRNALARLARNFAAGHAEVDPRDGPRTCRTCHLAVLCRIDELRAEAKEARERAA